MTTTFQNQVRVNNLSISVLLINSQLGKVATFNWGLTPRGRKGIVKFPEEIFQMSTIPSELCFGEERGITEEQIEIFHQPPLLLTNTFKFGVYITLPHAFPSFTSILISKLPVGKIETLLSYTLQATV